jgi:hypothetical protein
LGGGRSTHSNLKVYRLIGERAHLIAEAEAVLAQVVRGEDELALALLVAFGYDALVGCVDLVVYIEGAAILNLGLSAHWSINGGAYGEVEGDL